VNRTHYEVLGVAASATGKEIKAAYRRLVLLHHPDAPGGSAERFLEISQAYEIICDSDLRAEYDRLLKVQAELRQKRTQKPSANASARPAIERPNFEELERLFSSGRLMEAESMAQGILSKSPKEARAYAVMAEISRSRGDVRGAYKMYAYAAQFAPSNPVYMRKHDELLEIVNRAPQKAENSLPEQSWVAPFIGFVLCMAAAGMVVINPGTGVLDKDMPFSTFTMPFSAACVASGAVMAACLSLSDHFDRFEGINAFGRVSSVLVFMLLAMINLWLAGFLYIMVSGIRKSFHVTIGRALIALTGVTLVMTMGAAMSNVIDPYQAMFFSGSLVSVGAVLGWTFADGFRE
jgi:hypothetical protein